MAKMNRGDSHISIGQYMSQAGWPLVARVRSRLGYNDAKISPQVKYPDWKNLDDAKVKDVVSINNNSLYKFLYKLVGHVVDPDDELVYRIVSTLDHPKYLRSPSHKRFDATAVITKDEYDKPIKLKGRALTTRKLIQGWQQLRGSFEPLRKSLRGFFKLAARYKSPDEALHNDALGFVYGAGNIVEGATQIILVPFFLVFRLLKHLGIFIRHPFTGAACANLVVRFARDLGYSGSWLIEGTLETAQGIVRIAMQVLKWGVQMPLRYARTFWIGSKTYAKFEDNAGTQALIHLANTRINAVIVTKNNESGSVTQALEKWANNAFNQFIAGISVDLLPQYSSGSKDRGDAQVLRNSSWDNLRVRLLSTKPTFETNFGSWHDFCAAGNHLVTTHDSDGKPRHVTPEFENLMRNCYCLHTAKQWTEYESAKTNMIAILVDGLAQLKLKTVETETMLTANTLSVFKEVKCKAKRAEAKGQTVDGEKLKGVMALRNYTRLDTVRETIRAYDSDAPTPTF